MSDKLIQQTLDKRSKTHGDFRDNANTSQRLKDVIRLAPNYLYLSYIQRESLDLVCTKISRILGGDHNEPDHWLDILGYIELAHNDLRFEPRK